MKTNKLTAGILAAAMSAAFCGMLTSQALYTEYESEICKKVEVINSDRSISNYRPMELPTTNVSKLAKNVTLPDQYDPRGHKTMTAVKNQGDYGTCWSFSSIASIESSLFDYNPYVDLSEWYQATYMYKEGIGYPMTAPELSVYEQGSMLESTTALLLRGIGPVDEDDSPYGDEKAFNADKDADTLYAEADYRVTDVTYYPYDVESKEFEAQKNAVKIALYRGQELSMSYIDYDDAHDEEHHSYYLADEENRWYGYGHAVNIVGWDDHFPAENFVDAPPADGAWLVKNSWGPEFGENGYFWMSYCEASITDIAAYTAVPAEIYSDVYQYDHYGYGASLNHRMMDFDSVASKEAESAMMANLFVAEKDTMLKAVMFATAMPDENYEITVYTDLTDPANPTSGKVHPVTRGTMCPIGYHTVELSQAVPLTKGKSFSVVVKLSGDMGYHLTGEICNYGDYVRSDGAALRFGDSAASAAEISDIKKNQSFISLDGNVWEDTSNYREEQEFEVQFDPEFLEPDAEFWQLKPKKLTMMYGNVCIKALTCDTDKVDFSVHVDALAIGDTIELSNAEGKAIYYAVNDEEMQLYTEPIRFTAEMTIRAHVEGSETIYEQNYRQRSAVITGLSISEVYSGGETEFSSVLFRKNNGYFEGEYRYIVMVPGERILDQLTIKTTGAAEVVCNGVKLQNNEPTVISVNTENLDRALVLHVSAPGMKDSEYVVKLVEDLTPLLGDINIDGMVNAQDAAEILVYAANIAANGKPEKDESDMDYYGDVNYDNEVNALDATWVLIEAAQAGAMTNS